jgi:hypothetical protein
MFNDLTNLGYGLVVFAIIIGVGSIVLYNFGGSVGCLDTAFPTWNGSATQCQNSTGGQQAPNSPAYTNTDYLLGQLGSGGLAGWTPAIIAISVGILFLGAFMIRGSRTGRY